MTYMFCHSDFVIPSFPARRDHMGISSFERGDFELRDDCPASRDFIFVTSYD